MIEAITKHAVFLLIFAAWLALSYVRIRHHVKAEEKRRIEEKKRNFYDEVTW